MRIVEHSGERVVLAGIPGSGVAMAACLLIGGAVAGVSGWLLVAHGATLDAMWLVLGVLIGLALMLVGGITLLVGRERLEIDLGRGRGRY